MVGEQAGVAVGHGVKRGGGQFLRAKNLVTAAAHRVAAEAGNHVVKGGDVAALAGQADGKGRMGVHDGTDVRPGGVEVTMQAPFGRGFALATDRPRQGHVRDVSGCERGVRHAGGRDVETVVGTQADVAGGPPVEPGRLHGQGGSDELLARVSHRPPRRGTGLASLRGWPGSCRVR